MPKNLLAIHCTYPRHPSGAVDTVIARKEYQRETFQSLESVFREFAESLGWDVKRATFTARYGDFGGVRKNLSSLLIPADNGEHFRIAFYT